MNDELEQRRILQAQQFAAAAAVYRDRRERIATAVLVGFMSSDFKFPRDQPPNFIRAAVVAADALIAELDKEVKP